MQLHPVTSLSNKFTVGHVLLIWWGSTFVAPCILGRKSDCANDHSSHCDIMPVIHSKYEMAALRKQRQKVDIYARVIPTITHRDPVTRLQCCLCNSASNGL